MPNPESGGAWGILGGNFDPVHNGHINLANCIKEKKALEGILFVPSYHHPLKQNDCEALYEDRLAMLKLALDRTEDMQLSKIEAEQNLSGYTVDTIRELKKRYPRAAFCFIIGTDNVSKVKHWHRVDELMREIHFVAGSRPGGNQIGDIEVIAIPEIDISSRQIRNKMKSGAVISDLANYLPTGVAQYIFEKKLYR